jgi:hypothetical protein
MKGCGDCGTLAGEVFRFPSPPPDAFLPPKASEHGGHPVPVDLRMSPHPRIFGTDSPCPHLTHNASFPLASDWGGMGGLLTPDHPTWNTRNA